MDAPRFASGRLDIPRPRRVVTAPVAVPASSLSLPSSQRSTASSSSSLSQAAPSAPEDLVETLYNHPSVRIISFTSSRHAFTAYSPLPSDNDVLPGSLPPSSQLERTIAVGAFCIYRAPGSVAFLSCGSALQPILPKSQCWCIDEDNSRFILQIRRPQYWRIEVPVADPDDARRATLLRDVFDKILLFEKTECPFQRSFTVQLPDPPETPVKKKAWTAEGKNLISSPFQSDLSPPAHAPTAISRGKRATSMPRDISLLSFEPIRDDDEQEERRSRGGDPSIGKIVSDFEALKGSGAPDSISSVSSHIFSSQGESYPAKAPEQITVNLPVLLENAARDQTAASITSSSSPNKEALQCLSTPTRGSSLAGTEISHEVSSTLSTVSSCPDLSDRLSMSKKADETHQPGQLNCFVETPDTHISLEKLELETASDRPENMREFIVVSNKTTTTTTTPTTPEHIIAETQDESSLSDQQNDGAVESDHSNSEGDPASFEGSGRVAPVNLARKRMTRMLAGRSFTAPPQLTLVTSPLSKSNQQAAARKVSPPPPQQPLARTQSPSASTDSFHSVQSWHSSSTPPPTSPRPDSPLTGAFLSDTEGVGVSESLSQVTYASDYTTTPKNTTTVVSSSLVVPDGCGSAEPTPRAARILAEKPSKESIDGESKPRVSRLSTFEDKLRIRRQSHAGSFSLRRRALSPLPPAANIFSPPRRPTSQSRLAAIRRLPTAIIHKTIEILLSPPSHLVNLMLKVAARIAAGEWRGLVFGFGEAGEQIPVQWDYYSDGEFSDLSDSDDYTLTNHGSNYSDNVPRANPWRRTRYAHDDDHDSCEVD
ncbi:inheritance of peroxisomes protein 1-domain-containing protein [Hypoxylon argillaceum]|nr:inheritance of peroxisomes protein 1-domain-containing protein [Hypoxylon argillaceum]